MNILLTGASGFLGRGLAKRLILQKDIHLTVAARLQSAKLELPTYVVGDLSSTTDWGSALVSQHAVIHTAARAHFIQSEIGDPLAEYRRVNSDGTLRLARQAAEAGVKRFVFISSIGVNGNANVCPFTAEDSPHPVEPYAQSKWEAEQGLWRIQRETGMELVIIRPPLVYGPGAPGNFGSLVRWISKGFPLPLGAVYNKRSLVGIDNLVDLIICCIDHPAAANRVFLAGDGEDLSTTELLRAVGKAMGKPARLIPLPAFFLRWGAAVLGRQAVATRLLGSLQVDISQTCEILDWKPPFTVEEGLRRCFSSDN